jgi:hypothetical protein
MLDEPPPLDHADALAEHFHRQERAIHHFESSGWTVKWDSDANGFDLEASTDSELVLIRVARPRPSGDDSPMSIQGRLSTYVSTNGKRVSAAIVIAADQPLSDAQLEFARTQGLQVLRATRTGLNDVTAEARPAVPVPA